MSADRWSARPHGRGDALAGVAGDAGVAGATVGVAGLAGVACANTASEAEQKSVAIRADSLFIFMYS